MCAHPYTQRIVSGNSQNHEAPTMKKQIDPLTKAQLLRSARLVRLVDASFRGSKNSQLRLGAFRDKIMQPLGFPLIRLIVFGGAALGLAALAGAGNLPDQGTIS